MASALQGTVGSMLQRSCAFEWMGDTWCGTDVDTIFAYSTPRVTYIKDRTLGVLKLFLMVCIFLYIGIYTMWINGEHFRKEEPSGTFRLQWQQPVMSCNPLDLDCQSNYTDATDLPYCSDYTGSAPASVVNPCAFQDAVELPVQLPDATLIPSRIQQFKQKRACEAGATSCPLKYAFVDADDNVQTGTGEAAPVDNIFVADVERFTVLIDHSFETASKSMSYKGDSMVGYYRVCNEEGDECTEHKIKCVHSGCPDADTSLIEFPAGHRDVRFLNLHTRLSKGGRGRGEEIAREARERTDSGGLADMAMVQHLARDGPVAITDGDVFSIETLLQMSGVALDDPTSEGSLRSRGGTIEIRIDYSNQVPFRFFRQGDPPIYTISVSKKPTKEFKHIYGEARPDGSRLLKKAYGLKVLVYQTGEIRTFSLPVFLVVLTASMALIAMSNTLTDFIALYIMQRAPEYAQLKYKESHDFKPSPKMDGLESEASLQPDMRSSS